MIIDQINLNHLRIFVSVFKNRSMTKAADELYMTQSGISQHIKHLEELLQLQLFDRIKHKLVPTKEAEYLFEKVDSSLNEIENAIIEIKGEQSSLKGKISIGIPIEFGNNVIIPLLSQFGKVHPRVTYKLEYGYASDMNKGLLDGRLDFAVVDQYQLDKNIATDKIYDETLHLCVSEEYLKEKSFKEENRKFFESLDFIRFNDREILVTTWMRHHLSINNFRPKMRATLMDIEGAAKLVSDGFGAAILPDHMLEKLQSRGVDVHTFKGSDKPLINSISLAYVEGKSHSKIALELMDFIREKLADHNS